MKGVHSTHFKLLFFIVSSYFNKVHKDFFVFLWEAASLKCFGGLVMLFFFGEGGEGLPEKEEDQFF